MRLFILILLIATVPAKHLSAQKAVSQSVSNVFKVNFLFPGISYEQKVSRFKTIHISGYLNFLIASETVDLEHQYYLFAGPALKIEFRNYYNFKKREEKNLFTSMNSLNYVAPVYMATYVNSPMDAKAHRLIHQVGAVWGMQRNFSGRFSVDINAGLGYQFCNEEIKNQLLPILQFGLGFWLNNKNK